MERRGKLAVIRSIRTKLFVYYILLLAVFTISVLVFQIKRERRYRIESLESRLETYTEMVGRFIGSHGFSREAGYAALDSLSGLIPPPEIRISLISAGGMVLYDNLVRDYREMENHRNRPEVVMALARGRGYDIRESASTRIAYFYYARTFRDLVIRVAVVYNREIRNSLRMEHMFLVYLLLLFLLFGLLLWLIARRLGDSVSKLKDFVMKVSRDEEPPAGLEFSEDELGSISREITRLYEKTRKAKADLNLEKEKLISHLHVLREGVAFFSPRKESILSNNHFITYANAISGELCLSAEEVFAQEGFEPVNAFVDQVLTAGSAAAGENPRREFSLSREGRHYLVQCIFFQDLGFELLITDITQMMKRSIMKQQLTSNIAHELKTPISSVKGYLETILNNPGLEQARLRYFIDKAFMQTERLSLLVSDIALLNKIEESSDLYPRERVLVAEVIGEVAESLSDPIRAKNIRVESLVGDHVVLNANHSLVFSIFRNLLENSVHYGGEDITVTISCYHEEGAFYHFSFADNGSGVEEEHLPRLFERFYRVDTGRSRKLGGTGLGLAIVKNAILGFRGDISVRKRMGGGLEFLFSLPK